MALAIDSSSPVAHVAGVSTPDNQCASFIPPNDSLLLAMWAGDAASGGSGPLAPGATSSPGQTWTLDGWDKEQTGTPTVPGQAAIFHADIVGTSPGSTSVTVH